MADAASKTILVIDDELAVLSVTRLILSRAGYEVVTANSAQEAMRVVAEWIDRPIDLLLCDFVLPEMNGIELMRQIHKLRPDTPVLYFSAYSGHEELRPAIIRGVPYLAKPYTADQLLSKVRETLDGPKSKPANA